MKIIRWAAAISLAFPAAAGASALDEVIAVERAFAAETRERGFRDGFLAYVAPNGFTFQGRPVPARPGLEALPREAPPGPPLFWWPQFAGVANSGDLGFTTGGATIPVRYFTVWQRQSDGRWKWIYDGGAPVAAPLPGGEGDPVVRLPAATAAAGSAERALAELRPIEAELGRNPGAGRRAYLAADALVEAPSGAADAERLNPIGAIASRGGDLAFAWGELRRGERLWGHYARIWQKRVEGWRIVAEANIPVPAPPPG